MKFCTRCGAKILDDGAAFCSSCGFKLVKEIPQPAETKNLPVEEKITAPTKSVQEIMYEAKKKSAQAAAIQAEYEAKKSAIKNQLPPTNYKPRPVHQTDETFQDLFFKSEGRLNRLRFFKRTLLTELLAFLVAMILYFILVDAHGEDFSIGAGIIAANALDLVLVYNLIIRRSHDLHSQSFWSKKISEDDAIIAKFYAVLSVIYILAMCYALSVGKDLGGIGPMAQSGLLLYLCCVKGEVGENKFGADPLGQVAVGNSDGDSSGKFLALGAIALVLVVAAIASNDSSNKNYRAGSEQNYYSNQQRNFNYTCNVDGVRYKGLNNGQWGVALVELRREHFIYPPYSNSIRARGEFHIVTLVGTNYQNQADFFNSFELVDDSGRRFSDDSNATAAYQNMLGTESYQSVNPNQTEFNVAVFDIPQGVNITKIRYEKYMNINDSDVIELPYHTIIE